MDRTMMSKEEDNIKNVISLKEWNKYREERSFARYLSALDLNQLIEETNEYAQQMKADTFGPRFIRKGQQLIEELVSRLHLENLGPQGSLEIEQIKKSLPLSRN